MAIPGKNADLYRRLRLYGFGFVLGLLIVSFVYKGKGCKMPSSAKMDELNYQKLEYSELGECMMRCNNISKEEIKRLLKNGKINYDESSVHSKPFPIYTIESASLTTNKKVKIVIADMDTISRVVKYINLNSVKDTCMCD